MKIARLLLAAPVAAALTACGADPLTAPATPSAPAYSVAPVAVEPAAQDGVGVTPVEPDRCGLVGSSGGKCR